MLRLAREARAAGIRTLVTVTTKMFPPDETEFGPALHDPAELEGKDFAVYAAGREESSGKLLGIDPDAIPAGFDLVLIEADGAAHKPLTAPRQDDPVIPSSTTTVLAVAGLDAIGQPLAAMHRPEVICQLTGQPAEAAMTPAMIATVLSDPEGNTRGRPESARVLYVLNKADDELALLQGRQVVGSLPGPGFITVEGFLVWPQA